MDECDLQRKNACNEASLIRQAKANAGKAKASSKTKGKAKLSGKPAIHAQRQKLCCEKGP